MRDAINRIPGLAASTCFRESLLQVADELRSRNLSWREATGAQSSREGFENRIDAVAKGGSIRVNMPSSAKVFVKSNWPDYRFISNHGDELVFAKPIVGQYELVLVIRRVNFFGIGKAFTLDLNLRDAEVPETACALFNVNLFMLFAHGSLSEPVYTYRTKEDLQQRWLEADGFLRLCLPRIESRLEEWLGAGAEILPNLIPCYGPITAREGLELASKAAHDCGSSELQLTEVKPSSNLRFREKFGPGLGFDGKIRPHGEWVYFFFDPTYPRHLIMIDVPYVGSPRVTRYEREMPGAETSFYTPDRSWQTPLPEDWLDSDRVVQLADKAGGAEARVDRKAKIFEFIPNLSTVKNEPCWRVEYLIALGMNRKDYEVVLDPVTGETRYAGSRV